VHLKGAFGTIRFASPIMCQQRSGVIINTGSESGLGRVFGANYAAAKEGLIGLTRTVAKEIGRFNVRCNAIRPRAAGTTIAEGLDPEATSSTPTEAWPIGATPEKYRPVLRALGRYWLGNRAHIPMSPEIFSPERVAPLVVWLCTDAASDVNGQDFYVGGNEVGLYPDLELERLLYREGGWDLDALDNSGSNDLIADLTNRYLLDDHPELQQFEGA